MRSLLKHKRLLLAVAVIGVLAGVGTLAYREYSLRNLCTLSCGRGREIIIQAKRYSFVSPGHVLYYEVREDGQVVRPSWPFCVTPSSEILYMFDLVTAEDGDVAGVIMRPFPTILNRLPDFDAGECWSSQIFRESLAVAHDFRSGESRPRDRAYHGPASEPVRRLLDAHPQWQDDGRNVQLLATIKELSLGNEKNPDRLFDHVAELPSLEHIIWDRPLTESQAEVLSKLPRLRSMALAHAPLEDKDLAALESLTQLNRLLLPDRGLSEEAVNRLRCALPATDIAQVPD